MAYLWVMFSEIDTILVYGGQKHDAYYGGEILVALFCLLVLGGGTVGRGATPPVHYISPTQVGAPQTSQLSIHSEAADFDSSASNPMS
jgi:hypothetical protein